MNTRTPFSMRGYRWQYQLTRRMLIAAATSFSAEVLISGDVDAGDMVIKITQVEDSPPVGPPVNPPEPEPEPPPDGGGGRTGIRELLADRQPV